MVSVSKGLDREAGHHYSLLGQGLLAGDGAGKQAQGLVLYLLFNCLFIELNCLCC